MSSIGAIGGNIAANIENMNNLLKNITDSQIGLAEKMMKVTVSEKVMGLGDNIDIKV